MHAEQEKSADFQIFKSVFKFQIDSTRSNPNLLNPDLIWFEKKPTRPTPNNLVYSNRKLCGRHAGLPVWINFRVLHTERSVTTAEEVTRALRTTSDHNSRRSSTRSRKPPGLGKDWSSWAILTWTSDIVRTILFEHCSNKISNCSFEQFFRLFEQFRTIFYYISMSNFDLFRAILAPERYK